MVKCLISSGDGRAWILWFKQRDEIGCWIPLTYQSSGGLWGVEACEYVASIGSAD